MMLSPCQIVIGFYLYCNVRSIMHVWTLSQGFGKWGLQIGLKMFVYLSRERGNTGFAAWHLG